MRFNYGLALLILASGATLWGADNPKQSFRVPDPEEIYEAYIEGFLEYQDYLELMEIARSDFLTPEDSAYLLQFPDLLVGFSSNPLFDTGDTFEKTEISFAGDSAGWRQSLLFRQYARFDPDDERKRLFRLRGEYARLVYYGELEDEYSGPYRWGRRSLEVRVPSDSGAQHWVIFGSYKERFGLGLIYGYHGQLLSKSSQRADIQKFLYPSYGGGNGVLILAPGNTGDLKLLYDIDRNESHSRQLGGFSLPVCLAPASFELSALYGHLRTANNSASVSVSMGSVYVRLQSGKVHTEWELAAAHKDGHLFTAAAMLMRWRRRNVRLGIDGWHYHSNYPAWFSGGPSSRRSRTLHLDDIGLSYSDRYSGETGLITKVSHPIIGRLTFRSALGYARRGFDDDRIEARVGGSNGFGRGYSAKFDCYWRRDRLYSEGRKQRRVQIETVKETEKTRTRLVLGHRDDSYSSRADFLVMAEHRYSDRRGTLVLLCKLDKLKPNDMQNRYLYLAGSYEAGLGAYLRSYIKYTYRYDRFRKDTNYSAIRLDIAWVIE